MSQPRTLALSVALLLLPLAVVAQVLAEKSPASKPPLPVSIEKLLAAPGKWHTKFVVTQGTVTKYKERVSANGNTYAWFRLPTADGKKGVLVFFIGKLGLSDGKKVRVEGTFFRARKVGTYTFKNEIDASGPNGSVEEAPNNVTPGEECRPVRGPERDADLSKTAPRRGSAPLWPVWRRLRSPHRRGASAQ